MRVVIFQGQYGIFKREGLDLSMPAVQTCLGLYAISDQHDYLLCAHFDSAQGLQENLYDIKRSLEQKGISMRSFRYTIFGGDGKQSYFRCSPPSSHIGKDIIKFIHTQGGYAEYSPQHYSGIIPKTFNFHYKRGCGITEGRYPKDFMGGHPQAEHIARARIKTRPFEYSLAQAHMTDISRFY